MAVSETSRALCTILSPGRYTALAATLALACHEPPTALTVAVAADAPAGAETLELELEGALDLTIAPGDEPVILELAVRADAKVSTLRPDTDSQPTAGDVWWRPQPVAEPVHLELSGHGLVHIDITTHGPALGPVDDDRSLVWRDAVLLDDNAAIGLGRLMATIAADGHGGPLLADWFERFATTSYSSRPMPGQLIDEARNLYGQDPGAWELDALPFRVTAVHNRLDLKDTDAGCGQVRVTVASLHPTYAPLHVIFLFRQPALDDDISPDGAIHCLGTARRWSRLSALTDDQFRATARIWLDDMIRRERFLMAESIEREGEVWEWRQWQLLSGPDGGQAFENPPLFQTLDVDALSQPGPLRTDFLNFLADNAAGLDQGMVVIPARFRAPFAQMTADQPRPAVRIEPGDLPPTVTAAHPNLLDNLELIGCVACHTTPASEFVQTYPARFFSDFQFHELEARAALLDRMNAGAFIEPIGFGPLQRFDVHALSKRLVID